MTDASPGTAFHKIFGEALGFTSPGSRRRTKKDDPNKRLHALTPEGTHLDDESQAWLQRHQEKAQSRLERKVAARLAKAPASARSTTGSSAAPNSGAGSSAAPNSGGNRAPLQCLLRSSASRMPPLTERGTEPQVLLFDMDVLAERYRQTLWDRSLCTTARPGLVEASKRLRERFLFCALSRTSSAEALDLLAALHERGLSFDFAFALPPPEGKGRTAAAAASPLLDVESMRVLRDELGMTVASMERRLLAVLAVELEEEELDARLPASPSTMRNRPQASWPSAWAGGPAAGGAGGGGGGGAGSNRAGGLFGAPSSGGAPVGLLSSFTGPERPHVRLWLPGVTTLLVPHARLQVGERGAIRRTDTSRCCCRCCCCPPAVSFLSHLC